MLTKSKENPTKVYHTSMVPHSTLRRGGCGVVWCGDACVALGAVATICHLINALMVAGGDACVALGAVATQPRFSEEPHLHLYIAYIHFYCFKNQNMI